MMISSLKCDSAEVDVSDDTIVIGTSTLLVLVLVSFVFIS